MFRSCEAVILWAAHGEREGTVRTTAMEIVKKVLGDYGKEVVLLLSGTNTAHQVSR